MDKLVVNYSIGFTVTWFSLFVKSPKEKTQKCFLPCRLSVMMSLSPRRTAMTSMPQQSQWILIGVPSGGSISLPSFSEISYTHVDKHIRCYAACDDLDG